MVKHAISRASSQVLEAMDVAKREAQGGLMRVRCRALRDAAEGHRLM